MATAGPAEDLPAASGWRPYLVLWLTGVSLRLTILAVPPLVPAIHHDLHLTETLVGALTSLPVLTMMVVTVPGSLLIARVGARASLLLGLGLVALAGGTRGFGQNTLILFTLTFVMGSGIAISQPSVPTLIRQWLPDHIGRGTAIFSNGFLMGEILAASLTRPLILPLVGNSWPIALLIWAAPVALTAAAVAGWTPRLPPGPVPMAVLWWPDWRDPLTWRLGLTLGCASITYFGANAFIPDFLRAHHESGLISAALTSLNLCQLPASFVVAAAPGAFIGRRWPLVASGALSLIAVPALSAPGVWVVVAIGVLGFAAGLVFVLSLALPPLLAGAHDVHRLSAAMFTLAYACSFIASVLGGAIWDHTGRPFLAFLPLIAASVALMLLASGVDVGDGVA